MKLNNAKRRKRTVSSSSMFSPLQLSLHNHSRGEGAAGLWAFKVNVCGSLSSTGPGRDQLSGSTCSMALNLGHMHRVDSSSRSIVRPAWISAFTVDPSEWMCSIDLLCSKIVSGAA